MVESEDCPNISSNMQFLNHLESKKSLRNRLISSTLPHRRALRGFLGRMLGRSRPVAPEEVVAPGKVVTREDIMIEMTILNEHQVPLLPPLFVRALFDYEALDDMSLGFRNGDIIQVLTELDSGWWDGVLKDRRGWFPSNLVTEVSEPTMAQDVEYSQQRSGSPSVGVAPRAKDSASAPIIALNPPRRSAPYRSHVSRQSWTPGDEAAFTVASLQRAESPPLPAMPSLLENTWPWLRGSADSGENVKPGAVTVRGLRWSGMATAGSSDSLARSPKQYIDPKRKPPAPNGTAILPFHACQPHKFILCSLCNDPNPAKKRASVISAASIPKRHLPAFLAVPKHQALTLYHRYRQMRRLKHRHKKELARADQLIVQESPGAVEYRKMIQEDYRADCRELRRHWHRQRDGYAAGDDGAPLGWRELLFRARTRSHRWWKRLRM